MTSTKRSRPPLAYDINLRRPVEPNKQLNASLRRLEKIRANESLDDMAIKGAGELGATILQAYKLSQLLSNAELPENMTTEDIADQLKLALEYDSGHNLGPLSVGVTGLMRVGKANRGLAITFESPEFEDETAAVDRYLSSRFGIADLPHLHGMPHVSLSKGGHDRGKQWSSDDVTRIESQLPDTLVLHRPKTVLGYTNRPRA